ncbi:DoxX family protein [uncultured Polaribacter sp.]|uniref:DoxX family protein n=1 Tax=uncultured Polaribacter sp. TaxID=174711 RepID=UPI002634AD23|nr:DoxX family protein [uncultured Polaribacter sp.]
MDLLTLLIYFSSLAFIYFGINCFYSKFIIAEFERYRLPMYRKLIGVLQLIGAAGLLIGYYFSPIILLLSSIGLFLLMLAGFLVRIKIKDNFIKSSPAFTFAALNLFIALKTFSKYF